MSYIVSKLTSRKFWAAVVTFVSGLLIYFGKSAEQAEQICALIMSGAAMVSYIIGEGMVDAAAAKNQNTYLLEEDQPPDTEE